jgi:hypothetical protein
MTTAASGELLAIPAAAAAVILYRPSSLKSHIPGGVVSPVVHAFSLVKRRKKSVYFGTPKKWEENIQ